MNTQPLFRCYLLGIALGILVAVGGAINLYRLPSAESFPNYRRIDPATLPGRNPELESMLLRSNAAAADSVESFKGATTAALELARSAEMSALLCGTGFVLIFAWLMRKTSQLATSV